MHIFQLYPRPTEWEIGGGSEHLYKTIVLSTVESQAIQKHCLKLNDKVLFLAWCDSLFFHSIKTLWFWWIFKIKPSGVLEISLSFAWLPVRIYELILTARPHKQAFMHNQKFSSSHAVGACVRNCHPQKDDFCLDLNERDWNSFRSFGNFPREVNEHSELPEKKEIVNIHNGLYR